MGVEPGGNDDQIGAEILDPRQHRDFHGLAKLDAIIAGAERRIDDIVIFATFAGRTVPG